MKLNQLFSPTILVAALLVIAVWGGIGQNFLSAGSWNSAWQESSNLLKESKQQHPPVGREPVRDQSGDRSIEPPVANPKSPDTEKQDNAPSKTKENQGEEEPLPEFNNEESRELLKNSLTFLRNKSLTSSIRQRGMLFGTEVIASGKYLHADGGKGGARTELELQTQNLSLDIVMVNDGVYFFRQVKSASQSAESGTGNEVAGTPAPPTVERINLRTIREKMTEAEVWSGQWIAFGGLYLFMDQVRRSFDWRAPQVKKIRGESYQVITGTWKPEKLASLVPSQKKAIIGRRSLDWKRIPHQIPLQIEIYLVKDGELAGFPYRVIFYRPSEELLEGIRNTPVLITEFSDPVIIETPAQADFQFNAAENEVVDKTDEFLNSLQK